MQKTDYFLFLSISRVLVRDTHGCYLLASVDQILAVVRHVIDQKTPSGFPNSVRLTPSARIHDPALRASLACGRHTKADRSLSSHLSRLHHLVRDCSSRLRCR